MRRDAEAFGRDLRALRAQKDRVEEERKDERARAERTQKQSAAQIRVLREELDGQKEKVRQWVGHVCAPSSSVTGEDLVQLRQQHNLECKGLMVQIKYLKAKFTRESAFRCDLGYQKQYLLVLMARLERKYVSFSSSNHRCKACTDNGYVHSEERILAAVARIGFPTAPSLTPRRRTLRSVAYSVLFVHRTRYVLLHVASEQILMYARRNASEQWRQQRASKPAIEAALQEVRKRRAANVPLPAKPSSRGTGKAS